eukprot:jgi/Pico_ML_1/56117/g1707.t1
MRVSVVSCTKPIDIEDTMIEGFLEECILWPHVFIAFVMTSYLQQANDPRSAERPHWA